MVLFRKRMFEMFEKLSIILRGGVEVYSYTKSEKINDINSQLVSSFLYTIHSFFEDMSDPLAVIKMQNLIIYIKSYNQFLTILFSSSFFKEDKLDKFFDDVAKSTLFYLDKIIKNDIPKEYENYIIQIIEVFTKHFFYEKGIQKLKGQKISKRIALFGLGNAGKTSIINKFFNDWSNEQIRDIKPTVGKQISKSTLKFLKDTILSVDFGGQKPYRESYFSDQNNFSNFDSLIYVIDVQNSKLFEESKDYLKNLIEALNKNSSNSKPQISIFIHKFDKTNMKVNNNTEFFFQTFKEYLQVFPMYFTSIEDNSSNSALLRVLFLSLPDIMIKNIFEELLVEKLEDFSTNNKYLFIKKDYDSDSELLDIGISYGNNLSLEFQETWLKSITAEYAPAKRGIISRQVFYQNQKNQIKIEIQNRGEIDFDFRRYGLFIKGIIQGILSSLFIIESIKMELQENKTAFIIDY